MTRSTQLMAAGGTLLGVLGAVAIRNRKQMADITGQVVLITGGSRGLGLALAREFHQQGCRLALCARDEAELARARAILEADGIYAFTTPCDVTDRAQVDEMVDLVRTRFGRIDILINNAGQMVVGPIENMTVADFQRAMDVMFWGVLYPTLAVLPEMKARGNGRIATITSIGGKVSIPHLTAYCCAKFAAVAFSEGLRAEMAPHGVTVTTIVPGLMRTGSHLNAKFKGNHQHEAAWFSAAATLPVVSMSAERAARKTVEAVRCGAAEEILSAQAGMLSRLHGAFPSGVQNLLGLVNRLLPASPSGSSERRGADLVARQSPMFQFLTGLGQRAGARWNQ